MAEKDYREEHRKNVTNVLQDSFSSGAGAPRRGSLTGLKQRKLSQDTWLERCGLDNFGSVVKDVKLPASIVKQQEQQRLEQQRQREQQLREQAEEQQKKKQEQQRRQQEQQRREREAFLKRQQEVVVEQQEKERRLKQIEQEKLTRKQEQENFLRNQASIQTPIIANKTTSVTFVVGHKPASQPTSISAESSTTVPLTNGLPAPSNTSHSSNDFIDGSKLNDASAIVDSVDEKIRALDSLLDEFDSSLNMNADRSSNFSNEQQYPITKSKNSNPSKRYSMEEINDLSSSLNTLLNDLDNNKTYFKFDELESKEIEGDVRQTRTRSASNSSKSSDSGNRKVSFNIEEEQTSDPPGVHQVNYPRQAQTVSVKPGINIPGRDANQELADAYANHILPVENGALPRPKPINIKVSSRAQPVKQRSVSEGILRTNIPPMSPPTSPRRVSNPSMGPPMSPRRGSNSSMSPPMSPRRGSVGRLERSTWLERAGLDENKKISLT